MSQISRIFALVCLTVLLGSPLLAQSETARQAREAALRRLQAATAGAVVVADHKATGAARSVRIQPGSNRSLGAGPAVSAEAKQQQSRAFFRDYGGLIGISDPIGMRLASATTDQIGETHLTWKQFHGDVPVFAATIRTHFDAAQQLKAVTGTAIPEIAVSTVPAWTSDRAAQVAREAVIAERGASDTLRTGSATLYVYREGLAQGVQGPNHLAWEIEVTNDAAIRDLVYVSAQSGRVIDKVTGVHDDLVRRAYDGHNLPFVPPNYPVGAYWLEGQPLPTLSSDANNMLTSSQETYNFFRGVFGRDSFDGKGATMDSIFNRGYGCPNASWNGTFISFCDGLTTDDITAHEWGHAYTQYTHGLIYAWQPGALNEAYSDIWGEVIDQINQRGGDSPLAPRNANACSTFSPPVPKLRVNAPALIAADYLAQPAAFGPPLSGPITGVVVAALDAANASGPTTTDACTTITNATAISGNIALVDRGGCEFSTKVLNAQVAGAAAVVIANNTAFGLPGMGPGVDAPRVTIPSIGVQQATGALIRGQLTAGVVVNATLLFSPGTDASYKWLMGEDAASIGGALRDMWNPTCYGNPGKVTDPYYLCSSADSGGVHINSGIPNHAFALVVDGGTYNGRTISAIGLTKAAHIYYRAQSVYQVQDSDFADHADALEASCADLTGKALTALSGGPSSEVITAGDCAQISAAIAAVEMRTPPAFCNFQPLLNPGLPALCSATTTLGGQLIASFNFETNPVGWSATRANTSPDFTARDWTWVSQLPGGRTGSAFFAPNPDIGTCLPGGDESGVLELTSPGVVLPGTANFARATFDHWFATEPGIDGGNLQVSVNGGAWQLLPPSAYTFNNYTAFLFSAEAGNTNPLAGQPAWTGVNPGSVNNGSWGRTHVDLANFAGPGDTIRLRWNFGSDGCAGRTGWFVDNVNVLTCTPKIPAISVADVTVTEGDAGETQMSFTVALSTPTINSVSVNYELVDGTATHGNDYDRVSGTLVIPPSTPFGRIFVTIKGDVVSEGVETFLLRLSGAVNATIGDAEATATIPDDDVRPGSGGQ